MSRITLKNPLTRGDTTIDTLDITEPTGAALSGVNLSLLVSGNVDVIRTLLTRGCCQPILNGAEARNIRLHDLGQIANQFITMINGEEEGLPLLGEPEAPPSPLST